MWNGDSSTVDLSLPLPNLRQILRICLNLKRLIDKVIPIVFEENVITQQNSSVLNLRVLELAYKAAGGKGSGKQNTSLWRYRATLPFCLLKVCDWYWQHAENELSNNDLYSLRAVAAQTLAASIIDNVRDDEYLFRRILTQRYVIHVNDEDSTPVSALEMAVDMHSTIVIGALGYQRCIKWLWRGWIVQASNDPDSYVLYKDVANQLLSVHFNPSRIKTPLYQNALEIFFLCLLLVLYTIILFTHQVHTTPLDVFEVSFYLFIAGLVLDEAVKFYHVGRQYIGFWNVFNDIMYCLIGVAIGFRFCSLGHSGLAREHYDEISFRILSCASPFMWCRLLLFLDMQRFVGVMLVVVKTMMKESLLFFVLLFVVGIGFVQGFFGLDNLDGKAELTKKIIWALLNGVIGRSSFADVKALQPPYALILYYAYTFLIEVILMNILIALYSTSYATVVENANEEYFALVAQKTLRYIRAPDQHIYVPPLNLIEVCIMPLKWILSTEFYMRLNFWIMFVIYLPLLACISVYERQNARRIAYNRYKNVPDDANERDTEWDLTDGFEASAMGELDVEEHETNISNALRDQRQGEREDPEFPINVREFDLEIKLVVKPVKLANERGIQWDQYELYEKIDKLTLLVEKVLQENAKLRADGKDSESSESTDDSRTEK